MFRTAWEQLCMRRKLLCLLVFLWEYQCIVLFGWSGLYIIVVAILYKLSKQGPVSSESWLATPILPGYLQYLPTYPASASCGTCLPPVINFSLKYSIKLLVGCPLFSAITVVCRDPIFSLALINVCEECRDALWIPWQECFELSTWIQGSHWPRCQDLPWSSLCLSPRTLDYVAHIH